jgi:uncharacterized protein (DUF362 family)
MADKTKRYTRRQFIDRTAKGTVGLIGYSMLDSAFSKASAMPNAKSKVIVVKHDDASITGNKVDQDVAQVMVDAAMRSLTGIDDIGEAWKSIFPEITQNKVISIKINCIARQDNPSGLASHPEVAYSIVNGLTSMQVEGSPFPEENIIIWDRSEFEMEKADFSINKGDTGVKCYGTRYEIMREGEDTGGYSTTVLYDVNGSDQYLSKIIVDESDYIINTCLLKDHCYSGVTLSLKNHYGSCWDPLHMHSGYCNPYIPALNILSPIRDKQALCICDAIYAIISGGPMGSPQISPNSLIFSKDTVALDTIGYQMLEDNGTPSYTLSKATHIATAAQAPYNLGTNDPAQIDLINIDNPSVGIHEKGTVRMHSSDFRLFQNYPNPFNPQTTISYQLFKPANVKLNIYDMQGSLVRTLVDKHHNKGYYRLLWNGRTANGIPAPSGAYLGDLQIDKARSTIRMMLIK